MCECNACCVNENFRAENAASPQEPSIPTAADARDDSIASCGVGVGVGGVNRDDRPEQ